MVTELNVKRFDHYWKKRYKNPTFNLNYFFNLICNFEQPGLRSYLVFQRLCNETALSPGIDALGTKSWSKMAVRWRYADLSME